MSLADTSGCPSATAIACLCNDKTYLSQVEKCVQATCQGANLADAVSIGQTVCLEAVRSFLFIFSSIRKNILTSFACFIGRHFVCIYGVPHERESRCYTPRQLEQFCHRPCNCRSSCPCHLLAAGISPTVLVLILRIKLKLVTPLYLPKCTCSSLTLYIFSSDSSRLLYNRFDSK